MDGLTSYFARKQPAVVPLPLLLGVPVPVTFQRAAVPAVQHLFGPSAIFLPCWLQAVRRVHATRRQGQRSQEASRPPRGRSRSSHSSCAKTRSAQTPPSNSSD